MSIKALLRDYESALHTNNTAAEADEGNNEWFVLRREDGARRIRRYLFASNQSPA